MCIVFLFFKEERKYEVKAGEGMVRVVFPVEHSVITLQQSSFQFNLTLSEPPAEGFSRSLVLAPGASNMDTPINSSCPEFHSLRTGKCLRTTQG